MRGFSFTKSNLGFALAAVTLLSTVIALAIFFGRRTHQAGATLLRAEASSAEAKSQPDAARRAQTEEAYGKLPLSFEQNAGQTNERVKFLARGQGYGLFLTADEAVLTLRQDAGRRETGQGTLSPTSSRAVAVLRTKLVGANSTPATSGQEELAHKSNYFIGNDPAGWRTSVPNYGQVRYEGVYPGIDLIYYGNQRQLEYDFILAPGADTQQIRLAFDGARDVRVDERGELVLRLAGGEVRQHRPLVYQEIEGVRQQVAGHYVLRGKSEVGFEVGQYDASQPLVIDPVLVYSTYLGGMSNDSAGGIAVDAQGNTYLTGATTSLDFPVTPGVFQSTITNSSYSDAFVTKMNATGTALVYSTYLGAGAGDSGKGIGVDAQGNAYVTGVTDGAAGIPQGGFPTVNAFQSTFGGTDDAFVTKLNPTGSQLIFSTYMGGDDTDIAYRIAVNAATGEAYVAGVAISTNFPTTPGVFMPAPCPGAPCTSTLGKAFVAKFNPTGVIGWSTLIGTGYAYDVAADSSGNTYLTGIVGGAWPITPGAFQQTSSGADAFVAKMNPTGTALVYSTFLGGGPQSDRGFGIDIDASGNAYVTGQTQSPGFPTTTGAFDISYNGGEDAFVTKFNPTGTALIYSTFLGGAAQDVGRSIAIDQNGNAFITGQTASSGFPVRNSLQPKNSGTEIFLTKLNPAGSDLVYSTFLGGGDGRDVAIDASGTNAFVTGEAKAYGIPITPGVFQPVPNRNGNNFQNDAFVMKVSSTDESGVTYSISGHVTDPTYNSQDTARITVTLSGTQNRTTTLGPGNNFSFGALPNGTYTVTVTKTGFLVDPPSVTFPNLSANQSADFVVLENAEPIVTLTSPSDGTNFNVPGPVTITADASDSDGTVSRVEFSAYSSATGNVIIGTDTTAPYSIEWANVPAGTWSLAATAYDNLGRPGRSENLVFIHVLGGAGPSVVINEPLDGSTVTAHDYFRFRVTATPSGATQINHVEFYADSTLIGNDVTWPYILDVAQINQPGPHTLTAKAVDDIGRVGVSSPVNITVVASPPPTISGRVSKNNGDNFPGVKVFLTGAQTAIATTDANGNYAFPNLTEGASYTLTPQLDGYSFEPNSVNLQELSFIGATVDFIGTQVTPVTTEITSPFFNQQYNAPANIPIEATAASSAGNITKVDFYFNTSEGTTLISTDTTAPYTATFGTTTPGYYVLYTVATDANGATGQSDNVPVIINGAPTTVEILGQVRDGGGFGMDNVRVTLSGTQNAICTTNYFGYYFFIVPAGGNYTITPPPQYTFNPPGYSFTNLTTDALNADFMTSQFNTPPTISMTSPTGGQSFTMPVDITVAANAADSDGSIARVNFYARRVGQEQMSFLGADTLAPYQLNWTAPDPGTYEIFADAHDNANSITIANPVTITINPPPPGSISGRVVDRNSVGIPEVLVTLSGGQAATTLTDANGNYTFTNLPALSDYTLTPSKLNYTFSPQSRTVFRLIGSLQADFTATLVLQPSDFDGDGQTDVAVYRPATGYWYILRGRDNVMLTKSLDSQSHGDRPVPGNYDGDQQTDIALYGDGIWLIQTSSNSNVRRAQFGTAGDVAVPADYDGDGKTDLAVWRPTWSTFYVEYSSDHTVHGQQWGADGDVPAPGDYDGDGRADLAVFRPSNGGWYILRSTNGSLMALQWGMSGDVAVAGDYDGDDKTDVAVFRPSTATWYVLRSSNGAVLAEHWGSEGDEPVPGDYDLDGKTDIAIFRPGTGYWYINRSSNHSMQIQSWGTSGDIPVPFAYLPQ